MDISEMEVTIIVSTFGDEVFSTESVKEAEAA